MKKAIALLLSAVMLMSMAVGCQKTPSDSGGVSGSSGGKKRKRIPLPSSSMGNLKRWTPPEPTRTLLPLC